MGGSLSGTGSLRVAITNPYCWPQVRRGSERLLHELSHYLAGRGHDVTVIATGTEGVGEAQAGKVRRIVLPRWDPPLPRNRWLNHTHLLAFQVARALRQRPYDVVHSLGYFDAFGALLARRRGAAMRVIYQMVGITVRNMFRTWPLDRLMFRGALDGADTVLSISAFGQAQMAQTHGRRSLLLPAPTDIAPLRATPRPPPDGRLRLLFAGDTTEPRKGLLLLARALARVRAVRPDAVLVVSGHVTPAVIDAVRAAVPAESFAAIDFAGVGRVEDLPGLYARASVFVLPSTWEAQGMVLVEALATGTPVVACDHGGPPGIVSDPRIGRLFAPGPIVHGMASDDAALAAAIIEASHLADQPHTEALCRAHAEAFGWQALGPRYEAVLHGRGAAADDQVVDSYAPNTEMSGTSCRT
jgi:phosphatidyl-myo-inositol alpha-mannosyltransferase